MSTDRSLCAGKRRLALAVIEVAQVLFAKEGADDPMDAIGRACHRECTSDR
jgi:hypothetical protein